MKFALLLIALAIVFSTASAIRTDQIDTSKGYLHGDLDFGGHNAKNLTNGSAAHDAVTYSQLLNHSNNPTMVTVGPTPEYDIFINTSSTTEGSKIIDAVNLLMERSDNRGGTIVLAPCEINNSAGSDIVISHAGYLTASIRITGSGYTAWGGTKLVTAGQHPGLVVDSLGVGGIEIDHMHISGPGRTYATRSSTLIDVTCSSVVKLHDLDLMNATLGIDLYTYPIYGDHGSSLRDIRVSNCVYGIQLDGNSVLLENVATGYFVPTGHESDSIGIVLYGVGHHLLKCDGGDAGTGIEVHGRQCVIESMWSEPSCWSPISFVNSYYNTVSNVVVTNSTAAIHIDGNSHYNDIQLGGGTYCNPSVVISSGAEDNVLRIGITYSGDITDGGTRTRILRDAGIDTLDGVATPSTVAGMAQIYVDVSDGDLKVKFGDGTIKTIVADT